ncbi:DUF2075 domain-containing protein [Lysinibacillus xylanilyticus]|uniref:DUF2075 domain-containing protein n=1 Tax=Lysinibacillus xylanilyticus TaxID=582475 RepID=UPI0036DE1E23
MKLDYPVIDTIQLKESNFDSLTSKYTKDYPVVYVANGKRSNKYRVYVGEANDVQRRLTQHIQNKDSKPNNLGEETSFYVIGHKLFNKSLTLDIENSLMELLLSSESVERVENGRTNAQGEYYTSEYKNQLEILIWRNLNKKNPLLFPSLKLLKETALYKLSPFKKLSREQFNAVENTIDFFKNEIMTNVDIAGKYILIDGGAGTGKSVLLSNLFERINSDLNDMDNKYIIVNHDQQIGVYKDLAKKLGWENKDGSDIVTKPTSWINFRKDDTNKAELADVVVIDEAHLLWTQGKQSYQGENQLKDILKNSKMTVIIFDEKQILQSNQYWSNEEIKKLKAGASLTIELKEQFRITGNQDTVNWINNLVDGQVTKIPKDEKYDLDVFDNVEKMYEKILQQNKEIGLARMIATYDWEFKQGKKRDDGLPWAVKIGNFEMPWNYQVTKTKSIEKLPWAQDPDSIKEIGSTFSIQGFDLNIAGVILGKSVKYREGKLIIDPSESYSKQATMKRNSKIEVAEQNLRNELNVLLKRGVKGLYIYAVDEELREALLRAKKGN